MGKCKNCTYFKEDKDQGYICDKIWNVVIYDKDFEHNCQRYTPIVNDVDTSQEKALNLADVNQQRELFVSFARFAHNYKHSYGVSYEDMFSEWCKKRNK